MSDAISELRNYLSKSPSVVYPQDVLEYLPAIEAENAKLRAERDEWQRVAASKQDIIDHMRDTSSSNMRLRELVADMWGMAYPEAPSAFEAEFADRMSELGVEVSE